MLLLSQSPDLLEYTLPLPRTVLFFLCTQYGYRGPSICAVQWQHWRPHDNSRDYGTGLNTVTRLHGPHFQFHFMDTSSTTAQGHLLKVVEDEVKASERVTQEMKRRSNALVPV